LVEIRHKYQVSRHKTNTPQGGCFLLILIFSTGISVFSSGRSGILIEKNGRKNHAAPEYLRKSDTLVVAAMAWSSNGEKCL
jgi:hypothetical protein